jgi:hypothetical protein
MEDATMKNFLYEKMVYELPKTNHNTHHLNRYINFILHCSMLEDDKNDYYEKHHILPASLFPKYKNLSKNNWNSIRLTAREHYLCHWMLAKAFGGKMWFAFQAMTIVPERYKIKRYRSNSTFYETLRINLSNNMKLIKKSPEWCENISKGKMGYVRTEESKRKQSLSSKGKKKPDGFGDHVSKCLTGLAKSEDHKKKLSESLIGYTIVMDDDGNTFKVKSNDERFLSGELKSACFSKKTRIVHVYNENDELEYECINQNFQKFLKFHNLPYSLLLSYQNGGIPILSRFKVREYKGWYVKRIE